MYKLIALIALSGLAAGSLPDSKTALTFARSAAWQIVVIVQDSASGWLVHRSRAEPLCPLCIQQAD